MTLIFRLGSHPQDVSLCTYEYSKIQKKNGNTSGLLHFKEGALNLYLMF